jgi:glyoxylase-like metal-dependent hydrolase (beta-lactamase superfamily II)
MTNIAIVVKNDTIQIERLELGPFGTNTYTSTCQRTRNCVVVDAPGEVARILEALEDRHPRYILITHNHFDHVGALSEVKSALDVPVAAHAADAEHLPIPVNILLHDGDKISFGAISLRVLHTPGHTPGSVCFLAGNCLIAGDTLFPGGPGNTKTPADFRRIIKSISQKILMLPDDTQVYPGHGEATTVREARKLYEIFSSRPYDPNLCGDVEWTSS